MPRLLLARVVLCLTAILACAPWAGAETPTISHVTVEVRENGSELVTFESTAPVTPLHRFLLTKPDRVAIDIPHASGAGVKLPADYHGRLMQAIRFGQFNATLSRMVIDLKYPVKLGAVTPGAPFTLELIPASPLPSVAAVEEIPSPARGRLGGGRGSEAIADVSGSGEATTPIQPFDWKKSDQCHSSSCSKPLQGEGKHMAEDKKPLIAIDAGHGGQDPGAIGLHATHERDVTLSFAHALRKALLATGRYRVLLTRDDDHYILLPDRVAIARKAKADMFISMHADSNPRPEARGLSIYTLSATASDDEAAALADRENKSDIITGLNLNTTDPDVAGILIDLTQRETMNKSMTLADRIVQSFDRHKINLLPSTHRFAGFRVLKAPDVPSVLIELGFLSNATDERLLLSPDYRDCVVASIAKGVDRYYKGE